MDDIGYSPDGPALLFDARWGYERTCIYCDTDYDGAEYDYCPNCKLPQKPESDEELYLDEEEER